MHEAFFATATMSRARADACVMIALAHASSRRLLHEDTRQDKTSLLKIVTKNKLHPLVNQFTEFST
jgi:hypothetical protein